MTKPTDADIAASVVQRKMKYDWHYRTMLDGIIESATEAKRRLARYQLSAFNDAIQDLEGDLASFRAKFDKDDEMLELYEAEARGEKRA
jgi:hypothetical protein